MKVKILVAAILSAGLLAGCSSTQTASAKEAPASAAAEVKKSLNNDDMYVAYVDGRENVFYDVDLYKAFLEHGETAYRKTYIGAGTDGMTLVYGLTKADKKKSTNPAEMMMKGTLAPAESFYGEVYKAEENRFYVFSDWTDFDKYIKTGVDNLRYSDIAAGPKGETVIYVLNETNKKKKPVATIAAFNQVHNIK